MPSVFRRLRPRGRSLTPIVSVLVGVAALAALHSVDAPDAIWHPQLTDHPGYAPTDPTALQQLWPSVGTTVGPAAAASRLQAAALDAVGLGEILDPVWIATLLTVALAVVVIRAVTGSFVAATGGALALAFGTLFSSRAASGQPVMYGALFALATIACALRWSDSRRPWAWALWIMSYGAAVAAHPSALAALPVLLLFAWPSDGRSRLAGPITAAALVLAALLGGAAFWWSVGGIASVADWFTPQGARSVWIRLAGLAGTIAREFGALGFGFVVAGIVMLFAGARRRLLLLGGWSVAVIVWSLVFASPDWRTSVVPAIGPAWIVAGAGMAWLLRMSDRRLATVTATVLILLLPAMSFMANSHVAARSRAARGFVHRYLDRLEQMLPAVPIVVAEGGLLDRSIEGRTPDQPGWRRVPQNLSAVRTLWQVGAPVVGFARARANLEKLGVQFRPIDSAGVPMTLEEFLETVPDGWFVAAAFAGTPAASATLPEAAFRIVGGTVSFDATRPVRYVLIGVKARGDHMQERASAAGVELALGAGSLLGDRIRVPVALGASSTEDGAAVEVGGVRVAETEDGIAIAVISPAGRLAGALSAKSDEPLLVNPPALSPAFVAGVEPCVAVPAGAWQDVAEAVRGSAIGAIVGVKEKLVLYLGSRYALEPRLGPAPRGHAPSVVIEHYRTSEPGKNGSLLAALARDGAAPAIAEWPHVSRLEIASRGGRRQLALRLGGFVQSAHARLVAADPGQEVSVCSAVGGDALFSATDEAIETELDLDDDDLFAFGWDRPERTGAKQFRWTLTPSAGLLLPLAQPAALAMEITATSAAGSGALVLQVNDAEQPAMELRPGEHVHRWIVPAAAWHSGLNRVRLQVSDLVRGVDLGTPDDERTLGLAVFRIRLVRATN